MEVPQEYVVSSGEGITYREARSEDKDGIYSVDSSFRTNTVFRVNVVPSGFGFTINETAMDSIIFKKFPDDSREESTDEDEEDEEEDGDNMNTASSKAENDIDRPSNVYKIVALCGEDRVCGVIKTKYHSWNKRLTITCFEISPEYRRRGIGRKLMDMATERGRDIQGAKRIWLEVTNINSPAIKAYLRMGFKICGLDLSLYEGTPSEGEIALFMSRPC